MAIPEDGPSPGAAIAKTETREVTKNKATGLTPENIPVYNPEEKQCLLHIIANNAIEMNYFTYNLFLSVI